MTKNLSLKIIAVVIVVLLSGGLLTGVKKCSDYKNQVENLKSDKDVLLGTVKLYQTKDSLSAAAIGNLNLTLDEFKKYRAEDYGIIKKLKTKGRDIATYKTVSTLYRDTIYSLLTDTVIRVDTVQVKPAKAFAYEDEWSSVKGVVTDADVVAEVLVSTDLSIVETVKYKRFLGFLWKTNKVKDRKVDVVSTNPKCHIKDVEFITISK